MKDSEAHKIIREMLDDAVNAAVVLANRLQTETEEYNREPAEDTAAIIARIEGQHKAMIQRAEALALAVAKF